MAVSSSLNLPNFWLKRPHTWFNMCESAFTFRNITTPLTKCHHCMSKLPQEIVAIIKDVVNHFTAFNDPYEELKQCLCRAYSLTEQQKVNDLLDFPPLGVEKPSVLMDNILSLWPDTSTKMTSKLLLPEKPTTTPPPPGISTLRRMPSGPSMVASSPRPRRPRWPPPQLIEANGAAPCHLTASTTRAETGARAITARMAAKATPAAGTRCLEGSRCGGSRGASSTASLELPPSTASSPAPTQTR